MNLRSHIFAILSIVFTCCGTSLAGWGPSWVGGGPPGGMPRPANLDKAVTHCAITDDESQIGLGVRLWADGPVEKGHTYQLLYQLRLQTKKGESGPLLGTTAQPNGIAYVVASAKADENWNALEGAVDITRKELSTMTQLPAGAVSIIRVEPQLLDVTTNKYLTSSATDAIILHVDVADNGRVASVTPLARWIKHNGRFEITQVIQFTCALEAYDVWGNNFADAFAAPLSDKETTPKVKLELIKCVSRDWVDPKIPTLFAAMTQLSQSDDSALRDAAKQLLAPETARPANPLATPAPRPWNPLAVAPAKNPLAFPADKPAAPAPPPPTAAPAPNPEPRADAQPRALPAALTSVKEIGTGRLLVASFDDARSAIDVLKRAAGQLGAYFDQKPAFLGAYGDNADQMISSAFTARLNGADVRGLVIASVGAKGGSASIAFDRADAALNTMPLLLAAAPRGPVVWHDAANGDASIRLQLPQGWQVTGGQQGMADIAGPEGQFMEIGIAITINTPETERLWMMQQAQVGLPPRPSGVAVAPFSDAATAVKNVFPQFFKVMAANGLGQYELDEVIESTDAAPPPGMNGKAGLVHFTLKTHVNRMTFHYHVVANVICSQFAGGGQWMLYFSEVGAPDAIFTRDLPLMVQSWQSYKLSNREVMRRMDDAMKNMRAAYSMMNESAANARHVADRCNADWDEIIRGYRTVEDTQTGKWRDVDLGWSHKIVDKLNEHAGYARYREIPLRDQIFSP